MARDPLGRLRRLRLNDTGVAERSLAEAVAALGTAEAATHTATGRLQAEADAALDLEAGDGAVEAYMRWLPVGRRAVEHAVAREASAAKEVDLARAALGLARAAEQAVTDAIERRRQEDRANATRAEQVELDDASGRRWVAGLSGTGA